MKFSYSNHYHHDRKACTIGASMVDILNAGVECGECVMISLLYTDDIVLLAHDEGSLKSLLDAVENGVKNGA